MGKRVFEVAKDLGVDHRELLERCDSLSIDVRNYMSVLNDEDEHKLRGHFFHKSSGAGAGARCCSAASACCPTESAGRPGVLRVRRNAERRRRLNLLQAR